MSRMDVSFVRSYGFVVDLNDHAAYGAHVYAPLLDVGMPTVRHVGHEVFDLDGEVHHSTRYQNREVTVPVAIAIVESAHIDFVKDCVLVPKMLIDHHSTNQATDIC